MRLRNSTVLKPVYSSEYCLTQLTTQSNVFGEIQCRDISVSFPITIDIDFLLGHDSLYEEKQEKCDSGEIGIRKLEEFILVVYTSLKQ